MISRFGRVIIPCGQILFSTAVAYSDGSNNKESIGDPGVSDPCQKYNTISQRISWANRKIRCNAEKGCKFSGWLSLGTCELASDADGISSIDTSEPKPGNSQSDSSVVVPSSTTSNVSNSPTTKNSSNSGSITNSSTGDNAISINSNNTATSSSNIASDSTHTSSRTQELVEIIAPTAVDTLKASAEELRNQARTLVLQFLNNPENAKLIGQSMNRLLLNEYMIDTSRWLMYWSLSTNETYANLYSVSAWNRNYFLSKSEEGFDYSRTNFTALCTWWMDHPETKSTIIMPLIKWSFEQPDMVFNPVKESAISALQAPETKRAVVDFLETMLIDSLKSDDTRTAVKSELVAYLKKFEPAKYASMSISDESPATDNSQHHHHQQQHQNQHQQQHQQHTERAKPLASDVNSKIKDSVVLTKN